MAITNTVRRTPGSIIQDGSDTALRGSRYGDQCTLPYGDPRVSLCDEGNYFTLANTTLGTGIATVAAPTAISDTSPWMMINNTSTASGTNKRIYLDFLTLLVTAAGTNGTNIRYASKTDIVVNRYTSSAAQGPVTPVQCNSDMASVTSVAQVYVGPIVAAAASSAKLVGQGFIKMGIPVVGDIYHIVFGSVLGGVGANVATVTSMIVSHPPVVIGPGQSFYIQLILAAQSAASSYEYQLGLWER